MPDTETSSVSNAGLTPGSRVQATLGETTIHVVTPSKNDLHLSDLKRFVPNILDARSTHSTLPFAASDTILKLKERVCDSESVSRSAAPFLVLNRPDGRPLGHSDSGRLSDSGIQDGAAITVVSSPVYFASNDFSFFYGYPGLGRVSNYPGVMEQSRSSTDSVSFRVIMSAQLMSLLIIRVCCFP